MRTHPSSDTQVHRSALRLTVPMAATLALTLMPGCGGEAPGSDEASSPAPTAAFVQPGAPGGETRTFAPGEPVPAASDAYTEDDVHFMQMMIEHHAQALEMTALVPDRTTRDDIRMLARRIEASQADEIALMRRWLLDRDEEAPDPLAHAAHTPAGREMPGMLSPAQLEELASTTGFEFDRLFLELMVYHHEGAITMVQDLLASPAGAQEGQIYQFSQHVESDQRIEIERMRRMLAADS